MTMQFYGQSLHCRATRVERNLDDERRRYLSFDAHHVLGGTRAVGIGAAAISPRECLTAWSLRDLALAGLAEFARARAHGWVRRSGPSTRWRWNRWRGSPR